VQVGLVAAHPDAHLAGAGGPPGPAGVAQERGALVDLDQRDAGRRELEGAVQLVLGPRVGARHDRHLADEPEAERERAAPGVDRRVAEHGGAGARPGDDGAALPGRDERVPQGRLQEHRAQVHRRPVGEVEEAGVAHGGDVGVVLRPAAVDGVHLAHRGAEAREPARRPLHRVVGVLVGGRGRQHDDLGPLAGRQQIGVEGTSLTPFAAPHQGQRPGRPLGS
jgi:hypothetical protein